MSAGIPVRVIHPVPLLHRPPRARLGRLAVVAVETEAVIVEADPAEFREVLPRDWESPDRCLVGPDGQPWRVLEGGADAGSAPVPPSSFLDWLRGHKDYEREDDLTAWALDCDLGRTPLPVPPETTDPATLGEILIDLTEVAQDGVRTYLSDQIRVSGNRVLMRALPFVQTIYDQPGVARPVLVTARYKVRSLGHDSPFSTLGRLAEDVRAYWAPHSPEVGSCPRLDAFRAAFPQDPPGAPDADELALALPTVLWDWLDLRERRSARRAQVVLSDETRERLLRWTLGAQFGLMPPEGTAAMLRTAAMILDALADADPEANLFVERALATHIRARILPRVEGGTGLPSDDAAALSGLAGGSPAVDCAPAC